MLIKLLLRMGMLMLTKMVRMANGNGSDAMMSGGAGDEIATMLVLLIIMMR